jgi:glycosyltransferase involved in cell wall biosynthesis
MHIVIHTQYYPPEIGAPQTRLHELAIGLLQKEIRVTVLTAMPNYPQGRIYKGYKGWLQTEYINGIQVIRTAIYPTQSTKMLPRLLNYFSFLFSSLLIGGNKIGNADFVLTESPPLFLGLAGLLLSRWKHAKWIFNISDLWPESVVELGLLRRESLSYKLSSMLEKFLYKNAWVVTGQSKTILEYLQKRFPNLHTYHLPNGVDTQYFRPDDEQPKNERFHIMYAGLHGLAQGLDQILKAAQKLPPTEQVDFTFIGDGPEKKQLAQMAKDQNLNHIRFLDPVSKDKIPSILQEADALVVPLKVQLTGAVPSKLYEAMAMGKPVILIAASEAAAIVNGAGCGVVVQPGDIDGLVSAIAGLKSDPPKIKQMGLNSRRAAVQKYDRANIINKFSKFLCESVKG